LEPAVSIGLSRFKDLDLLGFSGAFKNQITAAPQAFGLQESDAVEYGLVHEGYAVALQTAHDPVTRTSIAVGIKNRCRTELELAARVLIARIEATPAVTPEQRAGLGLNLPQQNRPIHSPTEAPVLMVTGVLGSTITIKLRKLDSEIAGRPKHVAGARIFTYIGPEPVPHDIAEWHYQCSTSRTVHEIHFPATVPAFTKVHLAAAWFSPRQANGPMSEPISAYLGGGIVTSKAA
jgi:hypothetical protein